MSTDVRTGVTHLKLRSGPAVRPEPHARLLSRCVAPTVSVVIPAHNAATTIRQALRSLTDQGRVGFEAIVVDDGSTDATTAIVQRWMTRDPRVHLLRQAQSGVSAARNAGVAIARGEWLCFLDADDWLAPSALARLLALAAADPQATVLVGAAARVSESGRVWPYDHRDLADPFAVLSSHCSIPIHSALVRCSVVRELGGFDETLASSEDWDLWQRIARAGHRFAQTNARVAFYRARVGSLSRDLAQAGRNGLLVLRRAHAADPRVPRAEPRYAHGAPADDLPIHELYYLLWYAAREIACGGDGLSLVSPLQDGRDVDFSPTAIGELMASGMADMRACRPDELGGLWPAFEPKLRRVLEAASPGADRERLRRIALGVLKARLNGAAPGDRDVLLLERPTFPAHTASDDFQVLQLRSKSSTAASLALPALGARSGADLVECVGDQLQRVPLKTALKATRPWTSPSFWLGAAPPLLDLRGLGLRAALHKPRQLRELLRSRLRHALTCGLRRVIRSKLAPLAEHASGSAHLDELSALRAARLARAGPPPGAAPLAGRAVRAGRDAAEPRSAASWDEFFAGDDPWGYGASDYDRLKFADTLELIPNTPDSEALELACAEGHFSAVLAQRVGALVATDISGVALARAERRCAGLANVRFRQLDLLRDPLPGRYDLIVCSEVLYYAGPRLRQVARRLAAALRPGGRLVMAHANLVADDPGATGFDWGLAAGARTIGQVFAATPGLSLEREIQRPLYRVQAFHRHGDARAAPPRIEMRPLDVDLDRAVACDVVWGGGASRIFALRREVSVQVPILMYHRVAPVEFAAAPRDRFCVDPAAFAAQISALRRHGCWGVTPDELRAALRANRPLPGRPVMITFDDGYQDFAEHAWPVLQTHDFPATLFVVAGKVGTCADWLGDAGPRPPLMGWETLAALADAGGVTVESHGLTHTPLSRLPVKEVYRELLDSRAMIETATRRKPVSIGYPYGASDPVVERAARECGFDLAFSAIPAIAELSSNALRLPRIEISAADDLASFEQKLGWGAGHRAWS